jgi:phytanoyl-CoA hydroxylase
MVDAPDFQQFGTINPRGAMDMTATDSTAGQRQLPADLAERFVRDGYVVVDDLVAADERKRIIDDAAGFIDGTYPVSNQPADGDILAVHFPHWVSPVARDAVVHPGIADVVGTIAGAHLAGWDGRTKCMQSMLFFKPPGLQGQAWHQDERFIPTRDRSLVGAWIALDDATVDNGCLWVLPGSHRTGMIHPTRAHDQPEEFDHTDEAYGFDDSNAVAVEVRAGAVVFFNGYLLHRSLRNKSNGTRMALVNHYMNAWSLLPWQVGHGIEVGTADTRTIVPVTGDDPYPHKEIADTPDVTFVRPRVATSSARFVDPSSEAFNRPTDTDATPDHDGPALRIDTGVTIDAPVSEVWAVLTDLDRYPSWNPYIVQAQGAGTAGSAVTVTTRPTGTDREFTYDVDVVSVDAPRRLEWEGGSPDRKGFLTRHVWTLTETPNGTDLHHYETFHGTEAQTTYNQMQGGLRRDFDRFNTGLKAACENAN